MVEKEREGLRRGFKMGCENEVGEGEGEGEEMGCGYKSVTRR